MDKSFYSSGGDSGNSTLLSVKDFCGKHKSFKISSLRWLIFNRATNGLSETGAVLNIGRRIYLSEGRFLGWVDSQNKPDKFNK